MKKKTHFGLMLIVSLLIVNLIVGCQPPSMTSDPGPKSGASFAYIYAPHNPDYMVANYHNNLLDYYITHVHTPLGQHNIADTVYHFLKDSIVMLSPSYREYTDTLTALDSRYSLTGLISYYYAAGGYSATVRDYLFTYVNILDSVESGYDSSQYMARLDQLDQDVVNSIADSTVDVPLTFSATIRGSYVYWKKQWNDPGTLWDLSAWKARAGAKKFIPTGTLKDYILNIVGADGKGALEAAGGLIVGAAIASLASGGTLTLPAATAVVDAAIAGGGFSSLVAVFTGP